MIGNSNYLWTGNGYLNLYYSQRSTHTGVDFENPVKMSKKINQDFHDGPACFNASKTTLFTTRTYKEKIRKKDSVQVHYSKIYIGDLNNENLKFKPFKYNNLFYSVGHPTLSRDENLLIFASDMPGGEGESDLYFCLKENGEWSKPKNLGKWVNTFGNEYFPFLANDTTLFFASEGHMGYGGLDIFVSVYQNGNWQSPKNLMAPINSSYDDFGILLFNDLKSGYFNTNRPEGKGSDDIYYFKGFSEILIP
jgi:hypothetical protein